MASQYHATLTLSCRDKFLHNLQCILHKGACVLQACAAKVVQGMQVRLAEPSSWLAIGAVCLQLPQPDRRTVVQRMEFIRHVIACL